MADFPELEHCVLCEHRCGVNRLSGETGVCGLTEPKVATAQLHPAPPSSYTVFMAGCNYKCLNCQNWSISCYPEIDRGIRGFLDPVELAHECVDALHSAGGKRIKADRIFFSGGAPDVHLPYIEAVVETARQLDPATKVNFDTNGYLTEAAFERVLAFATSVTFDIKALDDETHRALTGASSQPVLRNAGRIGRDHPDRLWEYRVLVIPGINDDQIEGLCDFIAEIDASLPVCFLAFRPNFVLEGHPGASADLMESCVRTAREKGLVNAHWSGSPGIPGRILDPDPKINLVYATPSAHRAASYAMRGGCGTHPRGCRECGAACRLKGYVPERVC
ncbi:MAG: radical SAM protein [Planctomycetota bacterium]|jgi:pyruvate formate lyase activating enzyme